jgi:hypothetical protein
MAYSKKQTKAPKKSPVKKTNKTKDSGKSVANTVKTQKEIQKDILISKIRDGKSKKSPDKQENNRKKNAWKPGESGNPKGRPPLGQSLTDALRSVIGEDGKERIAKQLLDMAKDGYFPALKYIFDRVDGEPIKTIEAVVENKDIPVLLTAGKDQEEVPENEETE